MSESFYLSQDNDSHWYVIPFSKKEEWYEFLELDTDDPLSWEVPEWADSIGGSYTNVIFREYNKDGKCFDSSI